MVSFINGIIHFKYISMNALEKLCKRIAQKINLVENLHIAAIFETSESEDIIGWAVLDDNNNILKQYDEIDELFKDYGL